MERKSKEMMTLFLFGALLGFSCREDKLIMNTSKIMINLFTGSFILTF